MRRQLKLVAVLVAIFVGAITVLSYLYQGRIEQLKIENERLQGLVDNPPCPETPDPQGCRDEISRMQASVSEGSRANARLTSTVSSLRETEQSLRSSGERHLAEVANCKRELTATSNELDLARASCEEAPPLPPEARTQHVGDFAVKLRGCTLRTTELHCRLSIVNEVGNSDLIAHASPTVLVLNDDGEQLHPKTVALGAEWPNSQFSTTPTHKGVPTLLQIRFHDVPRDLRSFTALKVSLSPGTAIFGKTAVTLP